MDLLEHLHDREPDIGAGEPRAVMKRHALAQVEGVLGAVLADVPGFGEAGLRVEVEIVFQQTVVDLGRHLPGRRGGREIGSQGRGLGMNRHDQRSPGLLRQSRARNAEHDKARQGSEPPGKSSEYSPRHPDRMGSLDLVAPDRAAALVPAAIRSCDTDCPQEPMVRRYAGRSWE